jgi:stringent starvation protein B
MAEATITIPKVRQESDVLLHVGLTDNGVAVDWTSLSDIKAYMFSDAQRIIAGKCTVEVDGTDSEVLNVSYAATRPQYLGQNSLLIRCTYMGRQKSFDVPCLVFVARTAQATGVEVLTDPELDVQLEVEDVSTSLLDSAIAAALDAAADADDAAQAAETAAAAADAAAQHGPKIGENGNWYVWDFTTGAYVDTGVAAGGSGASNAVQYVPQTLTTEQKAQARSNIDAPSNADLNGKVDKVQGKGLSTNDYDDTAKGYVDALPVAIQSLQDSISAKYTKPSGGIPKTDLASGVQTSLEKADGAVRFDASQSLTGAQKLQARRNIGVLFLEIGTPFGVISAVNDTWTQADFALYFCPIAALKQAIEGYYDYAISPGSRYVIAKSNAIQLPGENSIRFADGDTITTVTATFDSSGNITGDIIVVTKPILNAGAQTLSAAEKTQVRTNIEAGTSNFSGDYNDLSNKPTIPDAQIQSDWDQSDNTAKDFIKNKPSAEVTGNKVTSLSSQSTDTQYPSAKCVYDIVGDVETLINAL